MLLLIFRKARQAPAPSKGRRWVARFRRRMRR